MSLIIPPVYSPYYLDNRLAIKNIDGKGRSLIAIKFIKTLY